MNTALCPLVSAKYGFSQNLVALCTKVFRWQQMPNALRAALVAVGLVWTLSAAGQPIYTPYAITTYAGQLSSGSADGTGSAARFTQPSGVAVDASGNVYVAEWGNETIRKIAPGGVVTTLAGLAGSGGSADGTGSAARFNLPFGVTVDASGNVYVADLYNSAIRKITSTGVVTTLAGLAGNAGSADGTGSAARFAYPQGVAVDASGNVFVADSYNDTIRKITPGGVVTTLAGLAGSAGSADGTGSAARFNSPYDVAVDASGNVFVADGNSTIRKIAPGGVVTTLAGTPGVRGSADGTGSAARFAFPEGVAVDASGNVFVADSGNQTIREIFPSGLVTTLAGSPGSTGSTDGAGSAARFNGPYGVTVDASGTIYIADALNNEIRKGIVVPAPAIISSPTAAGGVGQLFNYQITATNSPTSYNATGLPSGLSVNTSSGVISGTPGAAGTASVTLSATNAYGTGTATLAITIYVQPVITSPSTAAATVGQSFSYQITATNSPTSYNATGLPPGLSVNTSSGAISGAPAAAGSFTVTLSATNAAGTGTAPLTITIASQTAITTYAGQLSTGSADGTGSAARFYGPEGAAVDASGNVYIADTRNDTIRKIAPGGVVTTLAGLAGSAGSANGTGSAARFYYPFGVTVDASGNIYVAELGNDTIRKITPGGVVTTLAGLAGNTGSLDGTGSAARFNGPRGAAVDASGNVYVADTFNDTIRKVTPAGVVTTLAGLAGINGNADGTGSAARFNSPSEVAVDASGNVYVADSGNNTIRKITPGAMVTTLAGLAGSPGGADGTGSAARFNDPTGVTVDTSGNVYVADYGNNTIRKIMPGGVVTTLAGLAGNSGSADGTSSAARFNDPTGVAVDASGTIYIADTLNNEIRKGMAAPTPVITSSLTATGGVGQSFNYQITATNNPTSYNATNLPSGLSVNTSSGVISGTPTVAGTSSATLSAVNPGGTGTATLTITIYAQPVITSSLTATGGVGQSFNYQITATNNPTGYNATNLPSGLSVNTSSGVISGTPTVAGTSGATLSAMNPGGTGTATLTITIYAKAAPPTFSPVAGTYTSAQTVTISTATSGASIAYTTDASAPTESGGTVTNGTLLSNGGSVSISANTTINAIAFASGYTDSSVATANYVINLPQAATPTFNPPGGTYTGAQSVAISSTTVGASIAYTTDGSTPTESGGAVTNGTLLSNGGTVSISADTTLNAMAFANGYTDSAVATAAYTITAPIPTTLRIHGSNGARPPTNPK